MHRRTLCARLRALQRAVLPACALAVIGMAVAAPAAGQEPATGSPAAGPQTPEAPERVRLDARRHVLAGRTVRLAGRIGSARRGRTVLIEVRTRGGWRTVARARTGAGGRFATGWRPPRTGEYRLRGRLVTDGIRSARSAPIRRLTAYRAALASWFGPGLYGRRTACGRTLRYETLGVAHRSLPCRTPVTFRYRGRSVTVPVIDRGPYAGGREWDLTGATRHRLGFGSTGIVWSTR